MQLVPPSPSANGSAKRRSAAIGGLALARRGLRALGAAASTGEAGGASTGGAACCGDGCHIGMTCTTGGGAVGAAGCISGGGRDCAGLARNPSSQPYARGSPEV